MRRLLLGMAILMAADSDPISRALVAAPPPTAQTDVRQAALVGTASILGRVVDATTGAPVDDAVVSLEVSVPGGGTIGGGKPQSRPLPILVNGEGQFVFENLPGGAVTLRAKAPGYLDSGTGVRSPGGEPVATQISDAQHLANLTIRMWRFASIEGVVADESGDPIADVPVRLLQRTPGERRVVPGTSARTDDRGVFRFASLEPGRYLVAVPSSTMSVPASVSADYLSRTIENVPALLRGPAGDGPHPSIPGFRVGKTVLQPSTALASNAPPPSGDGHIEIFRTTFYPAAPDLAQAESVELVAGEERTDVTLTLPLTSTVSVSGNVAGADNLILRLVPVDVDDWIGDDSFAAASTMTDDEGAFTFLGVPPGAYVIEGRTNDHWVRARVAVANTPVADLSLTLKPNLRVAGRIRFVGSSAPPTLGGAGGFAWLARLRAGADLKPVVASADGRFSVDDCATGRFAFQVPVLNVPGGPLWAAASITGGGRDLLAKPFDLEADLTDVVITVTDRPTEVAGTVRTADEPLDVVAFPADYAAASDAGLLQLRTATVSVTSGRFTIRGLPAGNYLVAAIPHSEAGVWTRTIATIASQAAAVALTDGGRVTVDLTPVVFR